MAKIRWAIIGVGKFAATRGGATAIAYAHAEGLKRNADKFELVGACARTPANLEAFAAEYPCNVYTDMRELYAVEKPDGVSICTFAKDRVEHVKCAIDAGVKYVLVEKPVAMTLTETDEIRDYAEKRGVRLFVNFQRRFGRPFEMVKEAIGSGKLGRLYTIDMFQPCSNTLDFGPHFINMALWFLGDKAKCVYSLSGVDGADTIDWHGVKVEARKNTICFMEGGVKIHYSAMPENHWDEPAIRVTGARGYAELWADKVGDMKSILRIVTPDGIENPGLEENFHHGDEDKFLYFGRAFADLASAIATGSESRLDFAPAYLTQKMLD